MKKGRNLYMDVTRLSLRPGVRLTAVRTEKFKSSVLAVHLLAPLSAKTASLGALVPAVLRRGTERHPDMESLSAALDELYGGSLEPSVRKLGETQCVGFTASFLDDAYALEGERILEPAAALLAEVLLRPYTRGGAFCPDYTRQEKRTTWWTASGPRSTTSGSTPSCGWWPRCAGRSPSGWTSWGTRASAAAIGPADLWAWYQKLLSEAQVELYYCGSADPQRVKAAFAPLAEGLPAGGARLIPPPPVRRPAPAVPRRVEEALDVTQGKLAMGFRTGVDVRDAAYPALTLVNAVYGGTTTSKLFMNVRERLSLCYYASSGLMNYKT